MKSNKQEIKPLNSKVYFTLLPSDKQPKKTLISPDGDILKMGEILKVGNEVTELKEGDIITFYGNDFLRITEKEGVIADRSIIFVNSKPRKNKTHISELNSTELSTLNKARVISSDDNEIQEDDNIFYKKGASLILPDKTEIISNTQVFYKV